MLDLWHLWDYIVYAGRYLLNWWFVLDFKLAVLGACTCNTSGGQPCPCAKMAAVTRKQLLHLKQEVMLLGIDMSKQRGACAQNLI